MASKTDYVSKLKEVKDLIETANANIKLLENRIPTNHTELISKVCNVEIEAKEALCLAKKNEIVINEVLEKQQETNDDLKLDLSKRITTQVKEDLHINKIETQLRGVLLELEDLRNQSLRSNLIFKEIPEESKETWDNTTQLLAGFKTKNLKFLYFLARWKVPEDVWQKTRHINLRSQLKVIINQIFSKELTQRRNKALIKRKEYLR